MSGIIGGAGSKSGVIGETELDYEEGAWTPTSVGGSPAVEGVYVKIGNMVWVSGSFVFTTSGGGVFGALPFTPSNNGNAPQLTAACHEIDMSTTVGSLTMYISPNNPAFSMYQSLDNASWTNSIGTANNDQIKFSGVYRTA